MLYINSSVPGVARTKYYEAIYVPFSQDNLIF